MLFRNLYRSPGFVEHNFSLSSGPAQPDPAWEVEYAFRSKPAYLGPRLLAILSFTLSPECCSTFRDAHRDLRFSERDYCLSKLYQFLLRTLLDESMDPNWWEESPDRLMALLDGAFPKSSSDWSRLAKLDWQKLFDDYNYDLESLIPRIASYLPKRQKPPRAWIHANRLRDAREKMQIRQSDLAVATYFGRPKLAPGTGSHAGRTQLDQGQISEIERGLRKPQGNTAKILLSFIKFAEANEPGTSVNTWDPRKL